MYEMKSIKELTGLFVCNEKYGLSTDEANKKLKQSGRNELKEGKKKSMAALFLEQLNEPLIFILFVAAAISMFLREFSDTAIILVVILVNSVVGVIQEGKAMRALESLKKLTSPHAVVKRDGRYQEIDAGEVVAGDLVLLEAGRQVPADLRLIWSESLKIEEAALTGESVPVLKDASFLADRELPIGDCSNMAFMSTSVIYGRGEGMVIATGMRTEIGKIAGMINDTVVENTPLQKRLADLGKLLSGVAVILCVALFAIAVLQKRDIPEMLITAISLAVAAVPEGLPAVVTIVLALSVTRMVKVNTIVRRLPSVETLGAVNIVCSDKTGTLTQNKMTVTAFYANGREESSEKIGLPEYEMMRRGFLLCNDAVVKDGESLGDPTEVALVIMAQKYGDQREVLETKMPRIGEIPFDSDRKLMTTLHRCKVGTISFTKGSVDELLKRCTHIREGGKTVSLTGRHKKRINQAMENMAADALRVLGLACCENVGKPVEQNLTFIGMVGMIDPARPEVYHAVEQFTHAHVKTVMITGDHVDTAFAIAKQLGIAQKREECMTGEEIGQMTQKEFGKRIEDIRVFARVSPEHKVRIVKALKENGNIVAMTGDGVNDAPSLRTADIGIAMGMSGTDVARNAADIILTDDNFATIEKAIEEGRGIYENIKKSILFLLSSNFGEIITMFVAILLGLPSPLKASHILWINLITDSLPALALGVDQNNNKLLMAKPPRGVKESLFAGGGMFCTLFYGTLIAAISLIAFLTIPYGYLSAREMPLHLNNLVWVLREPGVLDRAQTYAFTVLGVSQLFHAVGMRNVELSIFRMNHFNNKLMIGAFFGGLALQIAVTEIPYMVQIFGTGRLALNEWASLIFLAIMPIFAHEILILSDKKEPSREKRIRSQV